jgi:hypothetical protein
MALQSFTSRPVWRISSMGTQGCYFVRRVLPVSGPLEAWVCNRVGATGWAKKPCLVAGADLFETRQEARAEYRRRRAAALERDPHAGLNLTT